MVPEKLYLWIVLLLVPVTGFISIILNYQTEDSTLWSENRKNTLWKSCVLHSGIWNSFKGILKTPYCNPS